MDKVTGSYLSFEVEVGMMRSSGEQRWIQNNNKKNGAGKMAHEKSPLLPKHEDLSSDP